jgi:hypothetical protein
MSNWKEVFDERELKEIVFNKEYFLKYRHGTDGHLLRMIIAKLAVIVDAPPSTETPLDNEQFLRHFKTLADAEKNYEEFAKRLGVSQSYLSMMLAGKRKPNAKLLKALGFKQMFVKETT